MRQTAVLFLLALTGMLAAKIRAEDAYRVRQGEMLVLEADKLLGGNALPEGASVTVFGREIQPVVLNGQSYFVVGVDFRTEPGRYDFLICRGGSQLAKKEILVEAQDFPAVKRGSGRKKLPEQTQRRIKTEAEIVLAAVCAEETAAEEKLSAVPAGWAYPLPNPELPANGGGFGAARIWKDGVSRHAGVDLRARYAKTYAIADGTVVMAVKPPQEPFFMQGYLVIVRHTAGIYSVYFHLSRVAVSVGQKVKRGDLLGMTGETGNARGPHLHFGMFVNCAAVDPLAAIRKFQEVVK